MSSLARSLLLMALSYSAGLSMLLTYKGQKTTQLFFIKVKLIPQFINILIGEINNLKIFEPL